MTETLRRHPIELDLRVFGQQSAYRQQRMLTGDLVGLHLTIQTQCAIHREAANTSASQCPQIGTTSQRLTDVFGQRPDVGTFAACDFQLDLHRAINKLHTK